MSGEMKFSLIASGLIFVVVFLAQMVGPRFLGWLIDKHFQVVVGFGRAAPEASGE